MPVRSRHAGQSGEQEIEAVDTMLLVLTDCVGSQQEHAVCRLKHSLMLVPFPSKRQGRQARWPRCLTWINRDITLNYITCGCADGTECHCSAC